MTLVSMVILHLTSSQYYAMKVLMGLAGISQ